MPNPSVRSPFYRTHFFLAACMALAGWGQASAQTAGTQAELSGAAAVQAQALRVTAVADQLMAYVASAAQWVDAPGVRMPQSALAPKIRAAVLAHPEVRLTQEQRERAGLATREAAAAWLPQVSANVEAGPRRYEMVSTPWTYSPAHNDNSQAVSVSARQLLYDFGAAGSQVQSKAALEAAASARMEIKSSDLALRALSAWLELFRGRELVAVSRMNVLSRQQLLAFIEEREQLGASARSDVLRARARLADAQATVLVAESRLTAAQAVYQEVFDEVPPPSVALPEIGPLAPERFAVAADLLSRNANLAEAQAQTRASGLEAKAASAALLPSLQLEMTARRRDMGGEGVPGLDWTAGVFLRQNLYSGGADVARKQQAEQRAKESQLTQDNVKRQLERALAQALAEAHNSTAAMQARKEAVQVAALAFDAVREQFAFRRGNLLDVLRAQEELYGAGRDMVDSVVDQALARYRLLNVAMELNAAFDIPVAPPAGSN